MFGIQAIIVYIKPVSAVCVCVQQIRCNSETSHMHASTVLHKGFPDKKASVTMHRIQNEYDMIGSA